MSRLRPRELLKKLSFSKSRSKIWKAIAINFKNIHTIPVSSRTRRSHSVPARTQNEQNIIVKLKEVADVKNLFLVK